MKWRTPVNELVTKFATADRFVDAAAIVCDETRLLGGHQCGVMLHRISGPAIVAVDNIPGLTDEHRLWAVTKANWETNPILQNLRARLGPIGDETLDRSAFYSTAWQVGYTGAEVHALAIPVIGPQGWFATVLYGTLAPCSVALERDLAMVATHLSVWCTAHGVGPVPDVGGRCLGPGQHRIAKLAATGLTNPEIADALGISVNTVKLRLKQVFERFGVDNRTELALVVLDFADDVPDGITRLPTVTITRAPREPKRPRRRSVQLSALRRP